MIWSLRKANNYFYMKMVKEFSLKLLWLDGLLFASVFSGKPPFILQRSKVHKKISIPILD